WHVLTPTAALRDGPLVVEIPPHQGVVEIAARLEEAGAVRDRWSFILLALARGSAPRLKAGEYETARGARAVDVLALIATRRCHPRWPTSPSWHGPSRRSGWPPATTCCGPPEMPRSSRRWPSRGRAWKAICSPTPISSCGACRRPRC